MKKEKFSGDISANAKEVDVMPTIELVEYERTAYIKGMEAYLQNLKSMDHSEALRKSKRNLQGSHIIQEDGEFTDRYPYSRMCSGQQG